MTGVGCGGGGWAAYIITPLMAMGGATSSVVPRVPRGMRKGRASVACERRSWMHAASSMVEATAEKKLSTHLVALGLGLQGWG